MPGRERLVEFERAVEIILKRPLIFLRRIALAPVTNMLVGAFVPVCDCQNRVDCLSM
jgi:hypothetical protein